MRRQFLLFIYFVIIFVTNCASVKVFVDYNNRVDFSKYYHFHFLSERNESADENQNPAFIIDPFFEIRARSEITSALINKGFQEATHPRHADFLVTFYAIARDNVEMTPPTYQIDWLEKRQAATSSGISKYNQGTFIIDFIDKEKSALIWRGVGSGVLDKSDPTKNLVIAIEKIVRDFPPKQ